MVYPGRIALLASEGAQLAGRHANIGGVDVPVHVEVRYVAMHPLAHMVGQPAHGQHVRRSVKHNAVVEVQPFPGEYFRGNRLKPWIVGSEACGLAENRRLGLHTLMIQK
jgi:hypothetical protein